METRSREELVKDIADTILDLDDSEILKIANRFLPREITIEDGLFKVGAAEFQPVKKRFDREEMSEVLSLDGKRLCDGDRIIVMFPDGTEYETVLESLDSNGYSSKENFYFIADHHGVNVRVGLVE